MIVLLHVAEKIANKKKIAPIRPRTISTEASARLSERREALETATVNLQAAVAKMKAANEKLAARMVEHKAFFDKLNRPK